MVQRSELQGDHVNKAQPVTTSISFCLNHMSVLGEITQVRVKESLLVHQQNLRHLALPERWQNLRELGCSSAGVLART